MTPSKPQTATARDRPTGSIRPGQEGGVGTFAAPRGMRYVAGGSATIVRDGED
jgi:hypothetical protein